MNSMSRSKEELFEATGGFNLTDGIFDKVRVDLIRKFISEPITSESLDRLSVLQNGGKECDICGFSIIDECICN